MTQSTTAASPADRTTTARPELAFAPHDLLSEKELAAAVGAATATLRNMRSRGEGPRFIKFGRLVRYRWSDVETYIAASTKAVA